MKTWRLNFRYRDARGELFDATETVEVSSEKKARDMGKQIAAIRAADYGGKYWLDSVERISP